MSIRYHVTVATIVEGGARTLWAGKISCEQHERATICAALAAAHGGDYWDCEGPSNVADDAWLTSQD